MKMWIRQYKYNRTKQHKGTKRTGRLLFGVLLGLTAVSVVPSTVLPAGAMPYVEANQPDPGPDSDIMITNDDRADADEDLLY